ncbi:hypothetical protein CTA1_6396 [Colletotrichum tanaceti]|uniref:Uncharacterized protein n=1 Tax=Colletotrichum tanaceti TaxID=1306861 RepID=A0A4V6DFL4_9PEZI|nr:hypothetical protein CTA1_6396 [Colletotrichum tanaceti]
MNRVARGDNDDTADIPELYRGLFRFVPGNSGLLHGRAGEWGSKGGSGGGRGEAVHLPAPMNFLRDIKTRRNGALLKKLAFFSLPGSLDASTLPTKSIPIHSTPPDARTSYIIDQLEGERITIPGSMGPGHLPDPRLFKSDKWRHRRLFERKRQKNSQHLTTLENRKSYIILNSWDPTPKPWASSRRPRWLTGGDSGDNVLPTAPLEPYFLRANAKPQCGGRFSIASIESSRLYEGARSPLARWLTFSAVDHCFCVQKGVLRVKLGGGGFL